MTAQTYPPDDEQQPLEGLESPGKRLRIARQAKGMTQADVAIHLHLSRSIIETLENDDYERLPGPVFARGYLRNYARLMGLDDASILAGYGRSDAPVVSPAPVPVHQGVKPEIRSSHFGVRLVSLILGLGLVGLLAAWWQGHLEWNNDVLDQAMETELQAPENGEDSMPDLPQPDQIPQRLPQISDSGEESAGDTQPADTSAAATETADAQPAPEPKTDTAEQVSEEEPPADAAGAQTAAPKPERPATGDASADPEIVFEFLGTCWVDIRDSTRKFKLFGEMSKGKRKVLGGKPPYSVILGNSAMVRVEVDGKPFDISSLTRGSVARFTLDPGNSGN